MHIGTSCTIKTPTCYVYKRSWCYITITILMYSESLPKPRLNNSIVKIQPKFAPMNWASSYRLTRPTNLMRYFKFSKSFGAPFWLRLVLFEGECKLARFTAVKGVWIIHNGEFDIAVLRLKGFNYCINERGYFFCVEYFVFWLAADVEFVCSIKTSLCWVDINGHL